MRTEDLIKSLAADAPKKSLGTPLRSSLFLGAVLLVYAIAAQCLPGMRADIGTQLLNPLFSIEIVLLVALVMAGTVSSILSMYPDAYQYAFILKLPFIVFGALVFFMFSQLLFIPGMADRGHLDMAGLVCTKCIAWITIIPAFIIFFILKRGASVRPWSAGFYAVVTSAGIGCLVIRLEEVNNSLSHMMMWHYLPTLCLALVGASLGRLILKW